MEYFGAFRQPDSVPDEKQIRSRFSGFYDYASRGDQLHIAARDELSAAVRVCVIQLGFAVELGRQLPGLLNMYLECLEAVLQDY